MKNLLIVDDEKLIRSSLSEALKMFDDSFNIITAENGEEAERILSSSNIDLLITDLNMPVKSGYELLAYMFKKQIETPVIVMTASSCDQSCGMLQAMNIKHLITKPINFEKMLQLIHNVLHDGRTKHDDDNNGFTADKTSEHLVNEHKEDIRGGDEVEKIFDQQGASRIEAKGDLT